MSEGIVEQVDIGEINIYVAPAPNITTLKLTPEELNRLGDGFAYTVQSDVRIKGLSFSTAKIGVFNNIILENLMYYKLEYGVEGNSTSIDFEYNNEGYRYLITPSHDIIIDGETLNAKDTLELIMNDERESLIFSSGVDLLDIYVEIYNSDDIIVEKQLHVIEFNTGENTDILESICDETDYETLASSEIVDNVSVWSDEVKVSEDFSSVSCEFTFNEDYPVYIVILGDLQESSDSSVEFTHPLLKESSTVENTDEQVIFPVPIKGMITDDVENAELKLNAFENSNAVVLYGFDTGVVESDDTLSVLGVKVNLTVDLSDDVIVLVRLVNPNGRGGERSLLIQQSDIVDRIISIGGRYDLWTFDITDMEQLNDWYIEIVFSNPYDDVALIQLEKVEVVFYVNRIYDQLVKCYLNGKDTRHYGMFLEEVDVPSGLKSEVKYLDIDGSDINDAYRQNIDKKEITIKFSVEGCNIEETTSFLKLIGKLFTNQRDELNRPIPNQLEFSHYPGEYWNVICEDPIDTDIDVVNYEGTMKLVVPDGTSYSSEEIVTSNIGNCGSIAKVNPVIVLVIRDVSASSFEVKENVTNQSLVFKYDKFKEKDIVVLDCADRTLNLKQYSSELNSDIYVDISDSVDWNADWFSLFGEYNFETTNCIIQTISFRERG